MMRLALSGSNLRQGNLAMLRLLTLEPIQLVKIPKYLLEST